MRIRFDFAAELVDGVEIRDSNGEVNVILAGRAGQDDNGVYSLSKLIGLLLFDLFDEVDKVIVQKTIVEMPFFDMLHLNDNSRFRILGEQVVLKINLTDRFEEFIALMYLVGMKFNA